MKKYFDKVRKVGIWIPVLPLKRHVILTQFLTSVEILLYAINKISVLSQVLKKQG